jgi:hypothetical protein
MYCDSKKFAVVSEPKMVFDSGIVIVQGVKAFGESRMSLEVNIGVALKNISENTADTQNEVSRIVICKSKSRSGSRCSPFDDGGLYKETFQTDRLDRYN